MMKNADLLTTHPLTRKPLRALEKLSLTVHEVFERLTALVRRMARVGMASIRRYVLHIEAQRGGDDTVGTIAVDPMAELLAEMWALCGIMPLALGVPSGQAG